MFLANLVFAGSFKGTGPTADVAFASNLIGIMLGGMLEYASLLIGYRNLLLIVIAFYVLSALLLRRRIGSRASRSRRRGPRPVADGRHGRSAGFPLAEHPRLRPIEVFPIQDRGRRSLVLRDPADPEHQPDRGV